MKEINWLTGGTAVGKSTWVKNLIGVYPVSTGRLCRDAIGEAEMAQDSNPTAPQQTEDLVRKLVHQAIRDSPSDARIVVDAMPRTPDQVDWILDELTQDFPAIDHSFIYAVCEESERDMRIMQRSSESDADAALIQSRLEQEDEVFRCVLERLVFRGVKIYTLDLSGSRAVTDPASARSPFHLGVVFDLHKDFLREVLPEVKHLPQLAYGADSCHTLSENSTWLRRFGEQIIEEAQEMLNEIPKRWWTAEKTDLRACRMELVDTFHFFLSACLACGMDAGELVNLYKKKRDINLARHRSGSYVSQEGKRDDEHLGRMS